MIKPKIYHLGEREHYYFLEGCIGNSKLQIKTMDDNLESCNLTDTILSSPTEHQGSNLSFSLVEPN